MLITVDKYAFLVTANESFMEIEIIVGEDLLATFLHGYLQIVVAHHLN